MKSGEFMKVSLVQMDIRFGDPVANFKQVREIFKQEKFTPGQLVILPEMLNTGYDLTRLAQIADPNGAETQALFSQLAEEHGIYLVAGSVARKVGDNYFNTSYVFGPSGNLLGHYDKVHLFGLMAEDHYLAAGDSHLTVEIQQQQVSTVICYDLRFPEWFRKQASLGTDLFVIPAQWPIQRVAAWKKLLQARAIENQAFVIGVNRVGSDPNNQFAGHSLVVDPLGEILLELGETAEVGTLELDFNQLTEVRGEIPVIADRRPEIY